MTGCLFCKIVAGHVPATVVKRQEGMLAFKDINPQAPTHLLVIPTEHITSLNDPKDTQILGGMLAFARDLAREAGIGESGYRVVVNTNAETTETPKQQQTAILDLRAAMRARFGG